jgi:hypothetical protein
MSWAALGHQTTGLARLALGLEAGLQTRAKKCEKLFRA